MRWSPLTTCRARSSFSLKLSNISVFGVLYFQQKYIERAQRYGFFAARPLPCTDNCPPKGEKAKIPPHHPSKPRKMRTFAFDENSADRTTTRRRLLHPGVQAELRRDFRHRPDIRSPGLPPGRMGRRRPSVRDQYLHRYRERRPPRAQSGAGSAAAAARTLSWWRPAATPRSIRRKSAAASE